MTFGIPAVWIGPDVAAVRAAPIQVSHRSPDKRVHDHRTDSPAPRARFAHALFCLVKSGPFGHVRAHNCSSFPVLLQSQLDIFNGRGQLGVRFAMWGPYRHNTTKMRVRITQALSGSIDGIHLGRFVTGLIYDVGTTLGNYLLAEGLAVPVDENTPALVLPPVPSEAQDRPHRGRRRRPKR